MTQRELAVLVKMNQSEVSAILTGRRVVAYDVLVRVADGLGIPRGMMGLAMTVEVEQEVDEDVERLPVFASYGDGHGVLASAELKLGNFDVARAETLSALRKRPKIDECANALDTIILATTNMRAGEVREGIQDTQRALVLVRQVGSRRLQERMMPLADELESRNDSTCRDLARVVRSTTRADASAPGQECLRRGGGNR